jgi:fructokinase
MARPRAPVSVTVLGECVADAFTDPVRSSSDEVALRALPGGGPANTAVALARLGTPTRFSGASPRMSSAPSSVPASAPAAST